MELVTVYSHRSAVGLFWVIVGLDGLWHPIWDGEDLGAYKSPQEAVAHLARGSTSLPSCGNPRELDISSDLQDWEAHWPQDNRSVQRVHRQQAAG